MNIIPLIFSVHKGLPEKKILPPTVPESPAFTLKKRIHREPTVDEVNNFFFSSNAMLLCYSSPELNFYAGKTTHANKSSSSSSLWPSLPAPITRKPPYRSLPILLWREGTREEGTEREEDGEEKWRGEDTRHYLYSGFVSGLSCLVSSICSIYIYINCLNCHALFNGQRANAS